MLVDLTFDSTGRIATLTHKNGLTVAKFLVSGPFKRNAEGVAKGFDDQFFGVIQGIGDYAYIDEVHHCIRKCRDLG